MKLTIRPQGHWCSIEGPTRRPARSLSASRSTDDMDDHYMTTNGHWNNERVRKAEDGEIHMKPRDRISKSGSTNVAGWLRIAGAGAGVGVIALLVASLLPLSSCGGHCEYCETRVDCTKQSVSACSPAAECSVKNGCLCSAAGTASGICTNAVCGVSYTEPSCETSEGCVWTIGCFPGVDCPAVSLSECTSHPSCYIWKTGCP
jgi:hypothetical protein